MTGRMVEFQCRKFGVGETWPRLMELPQKPAWLRPDFDHFTFNDSDQSSNEDVDNPMVSEWLKYPITLYFVVHVHNVEFVSHLNFAHVMTWFTVYTVSGKKRVWSISGITLSNTSRF